MPAEMKCRRAKPIFFWWVWKESNLQPPFYQKGVLPLNYTPMYGEVKAGGSEKRSATELRAQIFSIGARQYIKNLFHRAWPTLCRANLFFGHKLKP